MQINFNQNVTNLSLFSGFAKIPFANNRIYCSKTSDDYQLLSLNRDDNKISNNILRYFYLIKRNISFCGCINKDKTCIDKLKKKCKATLSKEQYALANKRKLLKKDSRRGEFGIFPYDEIKVLLSLSDAKFEQAEKIFFIPKRKSHQFSGYEIFKLVQLPKSQFEEAKTIFEKKGTDNTPLSYRDISRFLKNKILIDKTKLITHKHKRVLESMLNSDKVDINGAILYANAINELNGGTPQHDTIISQFLKHHADNQLLIKKLKADIISAKKYASIKKFVELYPNSSISKDLYINYYLKDLKETNIDPQIIEKCKRFYAKYNTQIYISLSDTDKNIKHLPDLLDAIDEEFLKWKKASKGKSINPVIIDFNKANNDYYKKNRAGEYLCEAYTNLEAHTLHFISQSQKDYTRDNANFRFHKDSANYSFVKFFLRHEMIHLNELQMKQQALSTEELRKIKSQSSNSKYRKYYSELKNGGLTNEAIQYAYTNQSEFIAVSGTGNTAEYSSELKKILMNLGLPKWVFDLDK